jgi:ribose 5-phosphate isomerase
MERSEMMTKDDVEKIVTSKGDTRLCIITSKYYNDSLAHFLFLVEVAKETFPDLKPEDIEIKHYTGRFRKGHNGIEFTVKSDTIPDDYQELKDETICSMFPTSS